MHFTYSYLAILQNDTFRICTLWGSCVVQRVVPITNLCVANWNSDHAQVSLARSKSPQTYWLIKTPGQNFTRQVLWFLASRIGKIVTGSRIMIIGSIKSWKRKHSVPKYLRSSVKDRESLQQVFRSRKSSLQHSLSRWLDISKRTQKAYDSKVDKTLYNIIRKVHKCTWRQFYSKFWIIFLKRFFSSFFTNNSTYS